MVCVYIAFFFSSDRHYQFITLFIRRHSHMCIRDMDSLSNINNKDEFNRKGNERLNEIYESRRVHGKDIKKNSKNELDSLGRTHVANGRSEPLLPSSSNVLLLPGREEKQRWLKGKKKTEDAE
ncbi:hypothetical protein J4536_18505 [Escherichia coli]|nr:hypothetical protein [Escherichia coli]